MDVERKAVKGALWSVLQKLGNQSISFVVFFLLARLLGPETFGLVALADVFMAFMKVFTDQGFAQAIVQRQELEQEHLDTAFWTNLGITVGLTLVGIAGASVVASKFNQPDIAPVIRWLSLGFLLSAFNSVQEAIFIRRMDFKALALRSLIAQLIGGVVGIAMAFGGFGVLSIVGQRLANEGVKSIVLWWMSDWQPGLKVSWRHFRELFAFGVNILGFNILAFFNRRSDDFLIGYFLGPVALGYYATAYRLLLTCTQLINSASQVVLPAFAKMQLEPEKLRRSYYKGTQFTSLIAFPAFLGLAALAPEVIPTLFGNQWTASVPVIQVLSFVGIVNSLNGINMGVILAMGKPDWGLKLNMLNATINVTAFMLVVQWGIVAVAAAFVIRGYVVTLPILLWIVHKLIDIQFREYLSKCAPALTGSLTMVLSFLTIKLLLGSWLGSHGILALCVVTGIIIYAVTIRLIARALFQQVLYLRAFIKDKEK